MSDINKIDYKSLLKKYITHVLESEGTDFLDHHINSCYSDVKFSKEEIGVLQKISDKICGE